MDQLPINLSLPWGVGNEKVRVSVRLCELCLPLMTFAVPGSCPLLCSFALSDSLPEGCSPWLSPAGSVLWPRSSLGVGSQQVSPLPPQQQAGGRGVSKFRLNFTLQIPDLQ